MVFGGRDWGWGEGSLATPSGNGFGVWGGVGVRVGGEGSLATPSGNVMRPT